MIQEYFSSKIGRKNKNIQPGPEKQYSYTKKKSVDQRSFVEWGMIFQMYIAHGGFNLSAAILKLIILFYSQRNCLTKCMEFQELVIIIFAIILSGFFYNTESKFEHPGSTYPPKTYLSSPTPQGQSRLGEGFQESSLS